MSISVAGPGGGKTLSLQWEAYQTAMLGYEQIVVDPKCLPLHTPIATPDGFTPMGQLKVGDQVIGRDGAPCNVTHKSKVFRPEELTTYEIRLDDGQTITADAQHQWVVATPRGRSKIHKGEGMVPDELRAAADRCDLLSTDRLTPEVLSSGQLVNYLRENEIQRWTQAEQLKRDLQRKEAPHTVRRLFPSQHPRWEWSVPQALTQLAVQMREEAALGSQHYQVITTQEMVDRLDSRKNGQTYFTLPLNHPIDLPDADLPLDPYVLGAWLGDGTRASGDFANPDVEILERIEAAGFDITRGSLDKATNPTDWYMHYIKGFVPHLHAAGVAERKHIPQQYMRASVEQRLELLRGLMDTDGTVHVNRQQCKITQACSELAAQIAELARSLGIKVTTTVEGAGYRDERGTFIQCQDAHGVVFQTDHDVFHLPRKRNIQPKATFRSKWRYVKDIVEVESDPAQCIRVDSPDHTYLAGEGLVLTHNTGSDLTPVFGAIPGAQIFSLDELAKADGAFDPLTYSETPEIGIPFAIDAIRKSDPYSHPDRSGQMEPDLAHALTWATANGATATLQALRMANDEGEFPDEHMRAIERLAGSYPAFRALCGSGESGNALRNHQGTTLIKVGSAGLKLPTPGSPPQSQMERINITLVKNVIFAATAALNHRKGVLRLDEAWIFTANDPEGLDQLARLARSQTIDITLYTQKISDALDIGLDSYISRGTIMHIPEEKEAIAACRLMKIEPTPERLERIMATGLLDDDEGTPDANSLKPLKGKDPATGEETVLRGAVAYTMDINGRVVPVVIDVPPRFIKIASTNIDDIRAREAEATAS